MGAVQGFVVLVTGLVACAAFLTWTLGPVFGLEELVVLGLTQLWTLSATSSQAWQTAEAEAREWTTHVRMQTPDVYFALVVPIFVSVMLLAIILMYGFFSIGSMPAPSDFKTLVDHQGMRQKLIHKDEWIDLQQDTPFVNDVSALQVTRMLHRHPRSSIAQT